MADSLLPGAMKTGNSKGKRKGSSRKGSRKGSTRRRLAERFAAFRGSDWAKLATFTAEVSGSSALASAAAGYFGDRIKLWNKVDARVLAAAAALGYAKFGKPKMAGDLTNVGIGVLTSWLNEQAHELGASRSVPAALPAPVAAEAGPTEGLAYVGNVAVGGKGAESRLEKKLLRLKQKAGKKGVAWNEVRHAGAEPAPAPRSPGQGFFRRIAHRRAEHHPQGRYARAGY